MTSEAAEIVMWEAVVGLVFEDATKDQSILRVVAF